MNRRLAASVVLGLAMAGASALTVALTPKPRVPGPHDQFSLDSMIPTRFSGWALDASIVPLTPDPDQQSALARIYDQTLSRTYINAAGQRVMLSIAYGGDQSNALELHLPEVCYTAQGFQVLEASDGVLATRAGPLPVKRVVARQNARNEPITYWITIGDKAVASGIQQKLQRLAYGVAGKIPDGMLVRVSTIQSDQREAWRVHAAFISQMLDVLPARDRARLLGAAPGKG
jgi:EpsI family protein